MPYPGVMPGNKLYILSDFLDTAKGWYTFGDIALFKYNLAQSDKYLIEAKILGEYGQYPLALKSLFKSDYYFIQARRNLKNASENMKNISVISKVYDSASEKHISILVGLKNMVPESFVWKEEKKSEENLDLEEHISESIKIRKNS